MTHPFPADVPGYGRLTPYTDGAPCPELPVIKVRADAGTADKRLPDLAAVIAATGLRDGMTVSFHHHLRNGDGVLNAVLEALAQAGIGDLTLAPSSIFAAHAPLLDHIARGTVTGLRTAYMAGPVAQAVSQLITGTVDKLILSRPAVEAGERLGFLPGDMKEKVDPYLRPLYDALYDCMPPEQVERRLASGEIEIAPIAFMRGRTLADSFIILDEAQNTTREQMKMFLTRFGQNSRMVVCGDPRQVDIPGGDRMSGLADAVGRLEGVDGIAITRFTAADVVRHPIVGRIVEAYEGKDA